MPKPKTKKPSAATKATAPAQQKAGGGAGRGGANAKGKGRGKQGGIDEQELLAMVQAAAAARRRMEAAGGDAEAEETEEASLSGEEGVGEYGSSDDASVIEGDASSSGEGSGSGSEEEEEEEEGEGSEVEEEDEEEEEDGESGSGSSVFDSAEEFAGASSDEDDEEGEDSEEEDDGFEEQGSSSDESEVLERQAQDEEDEDDDGIEYLGSSDEEEEEGEEGEAAEGKGFLKVDDSKPRAWRENSRTRELLHKGIPTSATASTVAGRKRDALIEAEKRSGALEVQKAMHMDDLSSDDEADGGGNRIGRVPLHWYDGFDHIGYDVKGNKLLRAKRPDGLEQAIASKDDPNYYRTVYDAVNDRTVVLSDRDLEIIRRMQRGAFAHPEFDAYAPQVDVYCDEEEVFGSAAPEPKRRFVPSKWEMMKVHKIVQAIKEGRMKVRLPGQGPDAEEEEKKQRELYYLLWKDEEESEEERRRRKGPRHIPAPKLPLPGHAESYNPPEEYLPTEEEAKAWAEMDPEDRPRNFLPRKFDSLRQVCGYGNFIKERFERCLDLYLCPRALRKTPQVDPDSLIPKLPNPKDLRPFPTAQAIEYIGHGDRVRCLAVSHDGQYLASGSDDGTVRLWEVESGYCLRVWRLGSPSSSSASNQQQQQQQQQQQGEDDAAAPTAANTTTKVLSLAWNPNPAHHVLAAAAGSAVYLLPTGTGGKDEAELTDALLASGLEGGASSSSSSSQAAATAAGVKWEAYPTPAGRGLALRLGGEASFVRWHSKGDYLASVVPNGGARAVMIHQVSKGRTQCPFKKTYGQVQTLAFHPTKPFFFVATQTHVRVYHLLKQALVKKLLSGCKWISAMDVHHTGDHVLLSSYDRRVVWFDLDLASTPYRTLKYHTKAVRYVQYHRAYPLMASASDDGTVHVFHCTVYDDLMQNPLIVPVKILRGHAITKEIGVMSLAWHPTQPWLFSCGADGKVLLFQDLY